MAKASRTAGLIHLPALELRERLATGALRAVELATAYLEQIKAREPEVQAWTWHEPDHVLQQAATLDAYRASGQPIGALHGLPVGIKDIIDTAKIPTANGTTIDRGRVPSRDATVVAKLRAAGAIIMGKTVTTELAFLAPGKTRNPHNTAHTPGGSSSGSAAAVASRMVPFAVGTQTAGSMIRPAAFCGVFGFKPSYGAIPNAGVLPEAPTLDTMGVFANTLEEAAMLADVLADTDNAPPPQWLETARARVPVKPDFAFVRTPAWDKADDDTREALEELTALLGRQCEVVALPKAFADFSTVRKRIHLAEMAYSFRSYEARGRAELHPKTVAAIDEGKSITATDYLAAIEMRRAYVAALDELFQRFDAIITPAAPGPAPLGIDSTGDPIFNELWTLCGVPAVTLPLFTAGNGLPMGVQLVGARGNDGRLLRTARWLVEFARDAAGKGDS